MRCLATALASLLFITLISPVTAQTSAFSITGIVVNTTTGTPVPNCHISANRIDNSTISSASPAGNNRDFISPLDQRRSMSLQETTIADDRGHFTLHLSSAGAWALRATATGYRSQAYDEHEIYSSAVVLTQKEPAYNLTYNLVPDAAIAGIILDEASEPVRQARVSAYSLPSAAADSTGIPSQRASSSTTDDRGHYEIAGLAPGNYRLSVQAHPWYAVAAISTLTTNSINPPLIDDPSLDAVYPVTWFPGTGDENSANTITLHNGETRQADINLSPMPSVHLSIANPMQNAGPGGRPVINMPRIQPVGPNAGFLQPLITISPTQFDIGGLAPGLYRVNLPGANGVLAGSATTIQITANSSRSLDLASAANTTSTVTLHIDGPSGADFVPLLFVDAANPANIYREDRSSGGNFGPDEGFGPRGGFTPGRASIQTAAPTFEPAAYLQRDGARFSSNPRQTESQQHTQLERPPRTIELPPGDYLVYPGNSSRFFLTGLTYGTKEIPSRLVSIPQGASSLTVHLGSGLAHISGLATLAGKPSVGAMVALVPISFGQVGSLAEISRDQTNTDGSFDLASVIPGQYILIAIDHGWNVNWRDTVTLAHYLANGIPLDLRTNPTIKQNLDAQLP